MYTHIVNLNIFRLLKDRRWIAKRIRDMLLARKADADACEINTKFAITITHFYLNEPDRVCLKAKKRIYPKYVMKLCGTYKCVE